jgi:hypothetical protein
MIGVYMNILDRNYKPDYSSKEVLVLPLTKLPQKHLTPQISAQLISKVLGEIFASGIRRVGQNQI